MKRLLLSTLASCALLCTALAGESHATPAAAAPAQTGHHRASAADTTPPGPVTGLTASGNTLHSITLEWTNPTDADLAHVLIRRAVGDQPPQSATDGTLVATLTSHATRFTDRKLTGDTVYSYAVFTSDRQQNLSLPSTLTAITRTTNGHTGVQGVLTDKQGNPIAGAWVSVRLDGVYAGQQPTGSDGSWRVTNIPAGTYTVCYETTPGTHGASRTGYLSGCYRQQPFTFGAGGTPVTVTVGRMTSGIRDYLPVAGAFSGRITDPAGTGLGDVKILIMEPVSPYGYYPAISAADGSYSFSSLPAGNYYICFDASSATGGSSGGYLNECYDDQPPWVSDTAIPVSLGHTTTGINAILALGGAVTGKVTDPAGNPVSGLEASLTPSPGPDWGTTDAQGVYRIAGIVPGTYTLCVDASYFTSTSAPYGFVRNCQDDDRPGFEVTAGQTVTQNRSLRLAGAIGGSVTGPDGSPVAGVFATVFDLAGAQVNGYAFTDENGNWQLPGLAPGQYTVCYDPTFTSGGFRGGCYDGQPNGTTTGTPVTVAQGQLTTVNDSLEIGAAIAGTVTDSTWTGLGGVVVTAVTPDGTRSYYAPTPRAPAVTR